MSNAFYKISDSGFLQDEIDLHTEVIGFYETQLKEYDKGIVIGLTPYNITFMREEMIVRKARIEYLQKMGYIGRTQQELWSARSAEEPLIEEPVKPSKAKKTKKK